MWKKMSVRRYAVLSQAKELLDIIATKYRIGTVTLRSKDKSAHIVAARREFCVRGRADNIQTKVLAAALECHHTTVTYHANAKYRCIKNARRYKSAVGGHHNHGRRTQAEEGYRQRDGNSLERRSAALRARLQSEARGVLG